MVPDPAPSRVPGPAIAAGVAVLYLVLAGLLGGRVPFLERHMFQFAAMDGPVVVPLFRADGVRADVHGFTDFQDLPPESVDVAHVGFQCSVEQHVRDQQAWLASHQADPTSPAGPVVAEVGFLVMEAGPDGRIDTTVRIDATGRARRAP